MNSRVKQAQKEGATVGDIAAGLSYSVIKNALFKVIKLRDSKEIGDQVIVQGGTFMSDATLARFRAPYRRECCAPGHRRLHGRLWCGPARARPCRRRGHLDGAYRREIAALTVTQRHARCGRCSNNCQLTINDFGGGTALHHGQPLREGRGQPRQEAAGAEPLHPRRTSCCSTVPVLAEEDAPRGTVGIPRALNMYENYPFWHAFFTKLGFRVVLSG